MAQNDVNISFTVTKAQASKMEAIRKWLDPNGEMIWDINHYAKKKFLDGFNQDIAKKKTQDEQKKAERELKKRQNEAENLGALDVKEQNKSSDFEKDL